MYRIVPIFSLSITFWIYTNKQMFDNKIEVINSLNQIRKSFHTINTLVWSELDWWQQKIVYALIAYVIILFSFDTYLTYKKHSKKNEV